MTSDECSASAPTNSSFVSAWRSPTAVKLLPPREAARLILDGMEANRYRVLVGKDSRFMDWLYRLNPERAAGFIAKQMKALLRE